MVNISNYLSQLPSEKRKLLEVLMKEEGIEMGRLPITPLGRTSNTFPPSFAQQRLWFLDQLDPHNPFYNIPMAVRLKGSLNVPALGQAFSEIIRRHEVIRATFAEIDGQLAQIIRPVQSLELVAEDLSQMSEKEAEVEHRLSEEARQPFDLSRGPLLRVKLLQLSEDEYVLSVTMHHIISDGWSMRLLVREISTLYEAFSNRRPSPLPELPIQYTDFAQWQRDWLRGEILENHIAYWRRQLDDLQPVFELPTDRQRPLAQSYRGGQVSFALTPEISNGLRMLSNKHKGTLFMTLLAAWYVLLSRYSGQSDIAVGIPIANRNRAEIEQLIGYFANTLVMRSYLSGNPRFTEI